MQEKVLSESKSPNEKLSEVSKKIENLDIIKHPKILKSSLTPLEYYLLSVSLAWPKPTTTRQYYTSIIEHIFNKILFSFARDMKDLNEYVFFSKNPFNVPFEIHSNIKEYKEAENLIEEYLLFLKKINSDTTKNVWITKKLKVFGIEYPSYEKIRGDLDTLESWGFLTKRFEQGKKADFFWIINPKFIIECEDYILPIIYFGITPSTKLPSLDKIEELRKKLVSFHIRV